MSSGAASLILLLGVLLIAGGVVVALLTGLDLHFLILAVAMIAGGAGLIWKYYGNVEQSNAPTQGPQRSVQKPVNTGKPGDGGGKHDSGMKRRL